MDAQLVPLAEALNTARIEADKMARQNQVYGIYGDISHALEKVLDLILGAEQADAAPRAYTLLLTGHTVAEALEAVRA